MNYIEKILISAAFIIAIALTPWNQINFLNHQDLNNYFSDSPVYNITENEYLMKESMNLCGVNVSVGEIVDKAFYNRCNKD